MFSDNKRQLMQETLYDVKFILMRSQFRMSSSIIKSFEIRINLYNLQNSTTKKWLESIDFECNNLNDCCCSVCLLYQNRYVYDTYLYKDKKTIIDDEANFYGFIYMSKADKVAKELIDKISHHKLSYSLKLIEPEIRTDMGVLLNCE